MILRFTVATYEIIAELAPTISRSIANDQSFLRNMKPCTALLLFFFCQFCYAQKPENVLEKILYDNPKQFKKITDNPRKYEIQILYTQIDRDAQNRPSFKSYSYQLDANKYFYPASTVKFPAVLLAMEKINDLKIKGLTINSTMLTDSAGHGQISVLTDTTAQNQLPSVAHYAKKILLVSDNEAFNRLYEFVGQGEFNQKLRAKNYPGVRILHRLSTPLSATENRYTNPIRFVNGTTNIYAQAEQFNPKNLVPSTCILKGQGYFKDDSLVREPFDFTTKNFFGIANQQEMLKAVLFPEAVAKQKRFRLTADDYQFLYQYMSQLPSETRHPYYDPKEFYDSYCKFTMFGDRKEPMPKHIRVFNKVGDAYGFLLDNAYIADFKTGVEFMLSAVIYCNEDQIFNDDKYEYDTIGHPFFGDIGRLIYQHELTRPRKHKANLSKFDVVGKTKY